MSTGGTSVGAVDGFTVGSLGCWGGWGEGGLLGGSGT